MVIPPPMPLPVLPPVLPAPPVWPAPLPVKPDLTAVAEHAAPSATAPASAARMRKEWRSCT